jgi:hypothetical protein
MEKNIHLIPTDKASRLYENTGRLILDKLSEVSTDGTSINQHIYITNSEEIKDDNWYLNNGNLLKCTEIKKRSGCKKIILTTDQDLIADGVQGIEDSFLEWFINNPTCEEVEVQKWFDGVDFLEYKIIIPQEKIKQTDENGSPMTFWGGLKKHKKESIEEGAEAFAESRVELDPIYANGLYYGFIECGKSKWFQAEKIKAQIEENLSVLEMLKIHGTESSMFRVKMRIAGLEQQLKQLYDGI